MPQAILFDLDDTIITEGNRFAILLDISEQLRTMLHPYTPLEIAEVLEVALTEFWSSSAQAKAARLGSHFGIKQARQRVIEETFRKLNVAGMPEAALTFSDRFASARAAGTRLFDDAVTTLETLQLMGVRLALVTNGAADIQRQKLARFELARFFDHVQIEGEHGFGKPEERAYVHALAALGVDAGDTWMVGDNLEWEVAAPQRLGIYGIWHDHRGTGLPASSSVCPDRIIRRWSELLVPDKTSWSSR